MKEQRKEALKIVDEQRQIRQKVLADIGEAAKKLINCSEEKENMDRAAVEALHQAEAGLRSLSIVMRQAAVFWKHMEVSIRFTIAVYTVEVTSLSRMKHAQACAQLCAFRSYKFVHRESCVSVHLL